MKNRVVVSRVPLGRETDGQQEYCKRNSEKRSGHHYNQQPKTTLSRF